MRPAGKFPMATLKKTSGRLGIIEDNRMEEYENNNNDEEEYNNCSRAVHHEYTGMRERERENALIR